MKNTDYIILGILLLVLGVWYFKKNQAPEPAPKPSVPKSVAPPRSATYSGPSAPVPTEVTTGTVNNTGNSRLIPNHQ